MLGLGFWIVGVMYYVLFRLVVVLGYFLGVCGGLE